MGRKSRFALKKQQQDKQEKKRKQKETKIKQKERDEWSRVVKQTIANATNNKKKKKEGKSNMNGYYNGTYGQTYVPSTQFRLTDFGIVSYKNLWSKPLALENCHNKLASELNTFISSKPSFEQMKIFMASLLSASFMEDGTPNLSWSGLNDTIMDNRAMLNENRDEQDTWKNRTRNSTSYAWDARSTGSRWGHFDDDEYFDGDESYQRQYGSSSPMTSAFSSDTSATKITDLSNEEEIEFIFEDSVAASVPFDVDHYIGFFEAIPDEDWTVGKYVDGDKKDVFGHLGCYEEKSECESIKEVFTPAADGLIRLFDHGGDFSGFNFITRVCDGTMSGYNDSTPKARILTALNDLKSGKLIV